MKNLIFHFVLLWMMAGSTFAAQVSHRSIAGQIDQAIRSAGTDISIGVLVKDPKTGKVIYSKNANHYYMPASNEKLFTAFAALHLLDKNFTYSTEIFADTSHIKDGVLNGNVYLRFSGDPSLSVDQLDNLIHALSQAGVHSINGNILVDDTAFDQVSMSAGSTWDDRDYCWGAPMHAINVENNCVRAVVTPSQQGLLAKMVLPAFPQAMTFINHAVTAAKDAPACKLKATLTNQKTYTITGCVNMESLPVNIEMAIDDPRTNLQLLITYLLNKNQIIGATHFEFKKSQVLPPLLASEKSPDLISLVKKMLKESDNTISNALFKTMGANYAKESGSFENGSEAVRDVLNKTIQLNIPETTLIDGDGASRYDFATPEQLVQLLEKVYMSKEAAIFISSLPIGGVDGTLKARLQDPITINKVFAKTGSETAVNTLSSYLQTQKNHTLIFSIMVNGFVDMPNRYMALQEQICKILIQNG